MPRVRRVLLVLWLALLAGVPAVAAAAEPPALVKARTLYNAGDYDNAIAAAAEVRSGDWVDAATLVAARAHLEKFRRDSQPGELQAGREGLRSVRSLSLMPRDQVDLIVGLGQSLYLTEQYGAAASLFDNALAQAFLLNRQDRLQLLDWWATAVDRSAQGRPLERRAAEFASILDRMEDELRRDAANPVANYWIAVAARSAGDVDRAWDASFAAWLRSQLMPEGAWQLGADLDRLMTQAINPERARLHKNIPDAARVMREQWDQLKEQWK
jgi:hypothetical protein